MAVTTKTELAAEYGFSLEKLRKLMNDVFYDDLLSVGYRKHESILSPRVLSKFYELYGHPNEFQNEK